MISRGAGALLIASMLGAGCAETTVPPLADLQVQEAWLEDFGVGAFGALGGGLFGSATLVMVDMNGERVQLPVDLSGGTAGWLVQMQGGVSDFISLDLPPAPITGEQLLGRYKGSYESLTFIGGVQSIAMGSEHGVRMKGRLFSFGVGITTAYGWLNMRPSPRDEPEEEIPWWDTGDGWDSGPDSGSPCGEADTGDTSDTGDTGDTADTGEPCDTGDTGAGDTGDSGEDTGSGDDTGVGDDTGGDTGGEDSGSDEDTCVKEDTGVEGS